MAKYVISDNQFYCLGLKSCGFKIIESMHDCAVWEGIRENDIVLIKLRDARVLKTTLEQLRIYSHIYLLIEVSRGYTHPAMVTNRIGFIPPTPLLSVAKLLAKLLSTSSGKMTSIRNVKERDFLIITLLASGFTCYDISVMLDLPRRFIYQRRDCLSQHLQLTQKINTAHIIRLTEAACLLFSVT